MNEATGADGTTDPREDLISASGGDHQSEREARLAAEKRADHAERAAHLFLDWWHARIGPDGGPVSKTEVADAFAALFEGREPAYDFAGAGLLAKLRETEAALAEAMRMLAAKNRASHRPDLVLWIDSDGVGALETALDGDGRPCVWEHPESIGQPMRGVVRVEAFVSSKEDELARHRGGDGPVDAATFGSEEDREALAAVASGGSDVDRLVHLCGILDEGDFRAPAETRTRAALRVMAAALRSLSRATGADLTKAERDVIRERRRQADEEGYDAEHDDAHDGGEISAAAGVYALVASGRHENVAKSFWPWDFQSWKPCGERRNLEKAASLAIAGMERIDRAEAAGRR